MRLGCLNAVQNHGCGLDLTAPPILQQDDGTGARGAEIIAILPNRPTDIGHTDINVVYQYPDTIVV
jgi:hypothetical protein